MGDMLIMYSFKNDYSEGAHPRLLNALMETNMEQVDAYGDDIFSKKASSLIKNLIERRDAEIHFFTGGTLTNLTAISAFLRPHEAAIAADTGHILVHETGSIEATGHKIISIPVRDGKLNPDAVQTALDAHTDEHMVKPKLVYISNPTEIGTIYTKSEIEQLSSFCKTNKLYFFMDGARLGSALCANGNDLCLSDIGSNMDAFYIGGTKNGALLGEALVICTDGLKEDFRFHMKQKGALLAKGRVVGVQFLEFFKDGLYFELANHANKMAEILREAFIAKGYSFLTQSPSNQIFPILKNNQIEKLHEKYDFYVWCKVDEFHSAIRLVTSWATDAVFIHEFINELSEF
jgi:threonine aldolase